MQFSKRSVGSIALVAVLMLTAITAGGMAATLTSQSEVTGSTTVDNYDGSPLANGTVEGNVSSTDPAFRVIDAETDTVVETLKGDDLNQTTDGGSYYHYEGNVSDAFEQVPINAGESKTFAVEIVDNYTLDDANETSTFANVTVNGSTNRAVFAGTESNLDIVSDEGTEFFGFSLWGAEDMTTFEEDDVGINGSGSTVELDVWDDNASEDFATSAEDKSSGDWIWTTQLWIEDESAHKVYYESAPDDVDSDDTYGVYNPTTDSVDVNVGEQYEDDDNVDIRIVGNDAFSISERFNNFGIQNALGAFNPF